MMAELRCFPGKNDEDRLRNLLRLMRPGDLPQRHGINQVDVPVHQSGKRFLGFAARILSYEFQVINHHHSIP